MRPINQTVAAAQTLQIPLDIYQSPGEVYIDCVPTGGATYGVQASNDDPFAGVPTNFTTTPPIAAATATATQATISGVIPRQLYVTVAGTGSVAVRVIQMGVKG
jgi:hypothetical protein